MTVSATDAPIEWIGDRDADARCPACGLSGPKRIALSALTLGPSRAWVTLVDCPDCDLRFFPDLVPASFTEMDPAPSFELGLGLAGSIDELARIDTDRIGSMLEVGCGTGFTLDFAHSVYGWRTCGVDDSSAAAMGHEVLGFEFVDGQLGGDAGALAGAWDLVFTAEVLEHVTDPPAFVRSLRAALAPGGTLLLRTPNGAAMHRGRPTTALRASLSPGYHTSVHTPRSLTLLLRASGFANVFVLAEGDALHAAASDADPGWRPDGRLDLDVVIAYLERRAESLPLGNPARTGLLRYLVDLLVNMADWVRAARVLERQRAQLLARCGADIEAPETLFGSDGVGADRRAGPLGPALLCSALYARARIESECGDRGRALVFFDAAARGGSVAVRRNVDMNSVEPASQQTARLARVSAAALAGPDDRTRTLDLMAELPPVGSPTRLESLSELFVTLVGTGSLAVAATLAETLESELKAALADPSRALAGIDAEAAYALAMVLLHEVGDPGQAAWWFERVVDAVDIPDERRGSARFHVAYALHEAGATAEATPMLEQIADREPGSGVPDDLVEHARRLLHQLQAG